MCGAGQAEQRYGTRHLGSLRVLSAPVVCTFWPFPASGCGLEFHVAVSRGSYLRELILVSCLADRRQWCAIAILFAVLLVVLVLFLVL